MAAMKFVMMIEALPGKYAELVKLLKHCRMPKGVSIIDSLAIFGKPDVVIIFEAENEERAAEFAIQFGDCGDVKTLLAQPMEKMKWTR